MITWVSGHKVEIDDWYDKKHFYFGVSYYRPGQSTSQAPARERSFLLPYSEYNTVLQKLDSVVTGLMGDIPQNMILSEHINGKRTIQNGIRI